MKDMSFGILTHHWMGATFRVVTSSADSAGAVAVVDSTAPIGFGLLTVDSLDQAIARSRDDRMNKGAEAAYAVLAQIGLVRRWGLAG